jgi:hypothetical protein
VTFVTDVEFPERYISRSRLGKMSSAVKSVRGKEESQPKQRWEIEIRRRSEQYDISHLTNQQLWDQFLRKV